MGIVNELNSFLESDSSIEIAIKNKSKESGISYPELKKKFMKYESDYNNIKGSLPKTMNQYQFAFMQLDKYIKKQKGITEGSYGITVPQAPTKNFQVISGDYLPVIRRKKKQLNESFKKIFSLVDSKSDKKLITDIIEEENKNYFGIKVNHFKDKSYQIGIKINENNEFKVLYNWNNIIGKGMITGDPVQDISENLRTNIHKYSQTILHRI